MESWILSLVCRRLTSASRVILASVYEALHDELMLDGKFEANLATFLPDMGWSLRSIN